MYYSDLSFLRLYLIYLKVNMPRKIKNPITGRKITFGGATHKRLLKLKQIGGAGLLLPDPSKPSRDPSKPSETENLDSSLRLFNPSVIQQQSEKFFNEILKKSITEPTKPVPTKLAATSEFENPVVPKNKNVLIGSRLPPAPAQAHSYYHHHAPFSQDFGDYVCVKKDTLRDFGMFIRDSMFSSVDR
jgi:hypothetical protein